ncbi:MAG: hypothetical protein IE889_00645 [Campylobacterales bacterium]|nr:hypothetical protein [Campylobacterales bacterium]
MGHKIKTVSNGANPDDIKQLLPYLYRIALSVDSVKADNYANLRDADYHHTLLT